MAWQGYKSGLIKQVVWYLKFCVALIAAINTYEITAGYLLTWFSPNDYRLYLISFLVNLFLIYIILVLLLLPLFRSLQQLDKKTWNKVAGILPGIGNGVLLMAMLLQLLPYSNITATIQSKISEDKLVTVITRQADFIKKKWLPVFSAATTPAMAAATDNNYGIEGESKLSFVTDTYQIRKDLEMEMLNAINFERSKQGLNTLKPDPKLCMVAREHAADMFKRGYFAHNTPEGINPFTRMHQAGIYYKTAGENLALAPTLWQAHNGLMHSPGHRANILNPRFGRAGIGILDGGAYGLMICQEFRD